MLKSSPKACPVCRLFSRLGGALACVDPTYTLDPSELPAKNAWCPTCLLRDMENGHFDPAFRRFFNRLPERNIPTGAGLIVSPADGILEVQEHYDVWKMIVHIRFSDVHIQSVPLDGVVISVERLGRGFFVPGEARYEEGVQAVTAIDTEIGPCAVKQMTSYLTPRIRTYLKPGEKVLRGQRLGRILLGSTALLLLPKRITPLAADGARVLAGESIIARYQ
ncbi:MAG: hypothetical protein A3J74_01435 [Elusimicrobia bacterium RIFCSPHIGHO2_02_FULL_57_9]|nr:MAG: hypothetical protein A3J74_01435 [Elusimicrobia bacterium RIFCSPHIGHO2_02_FULL_57_9]